MRISETEPSEAVDGPEPCADLSSCPRADATVVFVHGIGNQRPGAMIANWGSPLSRALKQSLTVKPWTVKDDAAPGRRRQRHRRTKVDSRDVVIARASRKRNKDRRVRITEINWSRSFKRPKPLKTIGWLLLLLPAVVLFFAFDKRDEAALEDREPTTWRRALTDPLANLRRVLTLRPIDTQDFSVTTRLVARLLATAALLTVLVMLFGQLSAAAQIGIGAVIAGLLLNPRSNLAGHVVVAIENNGEYKKIRERIREHVAAAAENSDQVMVIAHSQGGFIAHDVLSSPDRPEGVTALVGLGSGLKPILILRHLKHPRRLAAAWIILVGLMTGWWTLFTQFDTTLPASVVDALRAASVFVVQAVVDPNRAGGSLADLGATPVEWPWSGFSVSLDAGLFVGVGVYVLCLLLMQKLVKPEDLKLAPRSLSGTSWTEITSHQDLVGRLLYPRLPERVNTIPVTLSGNPLGDHVRYFKPGSPVPMYLAEELLKLLRIQRPQDRHAIETIDALNVLGDRRRRLRFVAVTTCLTGYLVLRMLINEETLRESLLVVGPSLALPVVLSGTALNYFHVGRQKVWLNTATQAQQQLLTKARSVARRRALAAVPVWLPVALMALYLLPLRAALWLLYGRGSEVDALASLTFALCVTYALVYAVGYRPRRLWVLSILGGMAFLFFGSFLNVTSHLGAPASDWWLLKGALPITMAFVILAAAVIFGPRVEERVLDRDERAAERP